MHMKPKPVKMNWQQPLTLTLTHTEGFVLGLVLFMLLPGPKRLTTGNLLKNEADAGIKKQNKKNKDKSTLAPAVNTSSPTEGKCINLYNTTKQACTSVSAGRG